MKIALVNTNRIKPPIAPIGLDYVAEALHSARHEVDILDLCWEEDWNAAVKRFFENSNYRVVGITLRNMDDCFFSSRENFLTEFTEIAGTIRSYSSAKLVVGGVGFSTSPETVMNLCKADIGVWGDGEFAFPELVNRIETGEPWENIPNLIWPGKNYWTCNPKHTPPLNDLPLMRRNWVDNKRYFAEGGQMGIETKRGCPCQCIYCADPLAKGRSTRLRPPEAVVYELKSLLEQNIDHIHTCDSEFNLPIQHALDVCRELKRNKLTDKLSWYAYCSPTPFTKELAHEMRSAGCAGINFGVDSGDENILKRLGRNFSPSDILDAAAYCKEAGIAVMFDLLLGTPGENSKSVTNTFEIMKQSEADRIGVALGLRVYQGTKLDTIIQEEGLKNGLVGGENPFEPLFFLELQIKDQAVTLIDQLIGDNERFFFFHPQRKGVDYNYNANQKLMDAIKQGHRGAYWDILRRITS